jgi:hypothetical protein
MFTARYGLSPYITQIRFFFKGIDCDILGYEAVRNYIVVIWAMPPCRPVGGYQQSTGTHCLHLLHEHSKYYEVSVRTLLIADKTQLLVP